MSPEQIAAIEAVALREQVEWSEAVRLLTAYGQAEMPEGWRPEQSPRRAR